MKLQMVASGLVLRDDHILLIWHKKHKEWLPPGGHVKENETPDDAAKREVQEETGLEIEISDSQIRETIEGVTRNLPVPFLAHVHNVGDHYHCCFYYLARPKSRDQKITLNLNEVENYRWFAEHELNGPHVPVDVQQISRLALTNHVIER